MTLFFQITLFFLFFYVLLALFMYISQERFLFYPTTARYQPRQGERVQAYCLQRHWGRERLHLRGWLVNPEYARSRLIIYYGGNGEDIFVNIDEFSEIQAATLFVAYRGYGGSEGTPGEKGFFADALAIFDDIAAQYQPHRIFVMGRSLGTGVACYVASKREVGGVILVTPFDSVTRLAQARYPWLPISLLLKHTFSSSVYAAQVNAPFLILYGGRDRIVPPTRTRSLLAVIQSRKDEVFIDNADHGTIDMHPQYWPAILEFLDR